MIGISSRDFAAAFALLCGILLALGAFLGWAIPAAWHALRPIIHAATAS